MTTLISEDVTLLAKYNALSKTCNALSKAAWEHQNLPTSNSSRYFIIIDIKILTPVLDYPYLVLYY
jgi:hypothetical protein